VWHRAHGRLSRQEKGGTPTVPHAFGREAFVEYLLRISNNGFPLLINCLRSLALIIARQLFSIIQAPTTDENDPPSWQELALGGFYKRHPELKAKRVKALDWNQHDNNIYDKITL